MVPVCPATCRTACTRRGQAASWHATRVGDLVRQIERGRRRGTRSCMPQLDLCPRRRHGLESLECGKVCSEAVTNVDESPPCRSGSGWVASIFFLTTTCTYLSEQRVLARLTRWLLAVSCCYSPVLVALQNNWPMGRHGIPSLLRLR